MALTRTQQDNTSQQNVAVQAMSKLALDPPRDVTHNRAYVEKLRLTSAGENRDRYAMGVRCIFEFYCWQKEDNQIVTIDKEQL